MIIKKFFKLFLLFLFSFQSLCAIELADELKSIGFVEYCNTNHGAVVFQDLYEKFDIFIDFLQAHPVWSKKISMAKERFIRSKGRNYYSTDVFGFYDESKIVKRDQISFYYSTLFHEFICSYYKEFQHVPEIMNFLQACFQIQQPYGTLFNEVAAQLNMATIFNSSYNQPPVLLKIVKYLPAYSPEVPHYDGSAFTLFLDSTDNESLLLSEYKSLLQVDDFFAPVRIYPRLDH